MKTVEVTGDFKMRFRYRVEVPDDFDVDCERGDDADAEYLVERLDNADFIEIVNANGGGEWEVDSWHAAAHE